MPGRRSRLAGLTLLEVVISISLITVLMGALLSFFFESGMVRADTVARADRMEIARLVLDRMASELRGCPGMEQLGFPVQQRLKGDRRSLLFVTTVLPDKEQFQFYGEFDELPPGQHDLREVGYQLWIDPEEQTDEGEPIVGGILRSEKKTLNQSLIDEESPEQLRYDLWSPELKYIEFRYFDGVEWTTTWELTQGNPLPQLIQVTVGFKALTRSELADEDLQAYPIDDPRYALGDDLPHPDRFSMLVRLPAADRFFSSHLQRVQDQVSQQLGVEGLTP